MFDHSKSRPEANVYFYKPLRSFITNHRLFKDCSDQTPYKGQISQRRVALCNLLLSTVIMLFNKSSTRLLLAFFSWCLHQIHLGLRLLLYPVEYFLDHFVIKDQKTALVICRLIPGDCPFARTLSLPGGKQLRIPPLCKINPLYDSLMSLRFRALSWLAERGKEENVDSILNSPVHG
jgi:hypothetical protein